LWFLAAAELALLVAQHLTVLRQALMEAAAPLALKALDSRTCRGSDRGYSFGQGCLRRELIDGSDILPAIAAEIQLY
jgi:hypothetical protein